ncbi:MAG: hypothetical protein C0593_00065 [Marinilabiliales bacterium]|nr:MAG: hypothetical protein C0593_00065 [Marinilabiliales bacterium]
MKIHTAAIIRILTSLLAIIVLLTVSDHLTAQEAEPLESDLALTVWQLGDGSIEFNIEISAEDASDNYYEVSGALVNLSQVIGDSVQLVAQTVTNSAGKASLIIPPEKTFEVDTEGFVYFLLSYDGDEQFRECEAEAGFKRVFIDVEIDEDEDSSKSLYVTAHFIDSEGNEQPLHDEELLFYVKRLYSWLPIGDIWMEEGEGYFDFPLDIPGDDNGGLTVAIRLEDSENFASAKQIISLNWGIPVDYSEKEIQRTLWSNYAPVWMIIALIFVLAGVWINFFLAIFKIFRMSKSKE